MAERDHVGELAGDDPSVWPSLDVVTGREKARVDTNRGASSGVWYTPGFARDSYTSTRFGCIARVSVAT